MNNIIEKIKGIFETAPATINDKAADAQEKAVAFYTDAKGKAVETGTQAKDKAVEFGTQAKDKAVEYGNVAKDKAVAVLPNKQDVAEVTDEAVEAVAEGETEETTA